MSKESLQSEHNIYQPLDSTLYKAYNFGMKYYILKRKTRDGMQAIAYMKMKDTHASAFPKLMSGNERVSFEETNDAEIGLMEAFTLVNEWFPVYLTDGSKHVYKINVPDSDIAKYQLR